MNNSKSKTEQIMSIGNGKGIQFILDEAYKILENPILVHDMEYKLIAHNEDVNDDPIWNEFITNGYVGYDRLIFYRDECFFETAANAKKITFLLSEKLPYNRLFGKIFTKNNVQIGCACMTASNKPFDDDDVKLFEIVCDILNKEFSESEFYQNYGQMYMESLIGQLIEGSIQDIDLYTAHIESIYIELKSYLRLVVVDVAQCNPVHNKLLYFVDLLKQTAPDYKYAVYADYIVIIMSLDNAELDIKNDLKKLHKVFDQNNIHAGISGCFENLYELQKYYHEAVKALTGGLKENGHQRIFLYDHIRQNVF